MNQELQRNGLQQIIDDALVAMADERGVAVRDLDVNIAEFCRRTGLSRSKARTLKARGFKAGPHGRTGLRAEVTVLTGYTDIIDGLLRSGVTNSSVCMDRAVEAGYGGSLSTVKDYIRAHGHLVPAKRRLAMAGPNRGRRFHTAPGEAFQMDWGFAGVEDCLGDLFRIACFAMVCHRCGTCYIEFFPNARQENLFIGMVHGFALMGVPEYVLTDNMGSVVTGRDFQGRPLWQRDYAQFMGDIGFSTRLCRPRHPFTKGKVERLIRFVKDNFLAARDFVNLTRLNAEALQWCSRQASAYHRGLGCVPAARHGDECAPALGVLDRAGAAAYLCPIRKISFDGFVSYEGRRFGVPYWYDQGRCRINREGDRIHIYSLDLTRELAVHPVTWSRSDSPCAGQYADGAPEEMPTAPVAPRLTHVPAPRLLSKFDFGEAM